MAELEHITPEQIAQYGVVAAPDRLTGKADDNKKIFDRLVRELVGGGAIFGHVVIPADFHISIFVMAPGAFFVLASLQALQNKIKHPVKREGQGDPAMACGGCCANCMDAVCAENHRKLEQAKEASKK